MREAALLVVALVGPVVTGGPPGDGALLAEEVPIVVDGSRLGTLRGARLPDEATRPPSDPTLAAPWLVPDIVVGMLDLVRPWHDARGATLAVGLYDLRYAIQPPRKEHAGTSPWRDFLVLVPEASPGGATSPGEPVHGSHPLVLPLRRELDEPGAEGETRVAFAVEVARGGRPPERRAVVLVVDPPAGEPAL